MLTGVPKQSFIDFLELDSYLINNTNWYYTLVDAAYGGDNISALLGLYRQLVDEKKTPDEIANAIFLNAEPVMKSMSGIIMKCWLFGVWMGASQASYIVNPDYSRDFVISAKAYVNSFSWKMAQAHPMGYSNFAFGSWGAEPPTLEQYGIKT